MSLGNLLSNSFLVSVGVSLLIVSIASYFFLQKMNDQNHKISSMLGLVSTMAEELNMVKGQMHQNMMVIGKGINPMQTSNGGINTSNIQDQINKLHSRGVREDDNSLISVSDDSEEDSDDSEDESDYDSEDGSDDDSESVKGTVNEEKFLNDVKVINMGSENEEEKIKNQEITSFDIDDEDDGDDDGDDDDEHDNEDDDDDDSDDDDQDDDSENIELIGEIDIEEIGAPEQEIQSNEVKVSDQLLMVVDPTDNLETSAKVFDFPVIDYKKMTLPKLKEYVKVNGFIEHPNKMKKGEIVHFLENM